MAAKLSLTAVVLEAFKGGIKALHEAPSVPPSGTATEGTDGPNDGVAALRIDLQSLEETYLHAEVVDEIAEGFRQMTLLWVRYTAIYKPSNV